MDSGKLVAFDIRQRCMLEVDAFDRRNCHRSAIISISHSHEHNLFGTASSMLHQNMGLNNFEFEVHVPKRA